MPLELVTFSRNYPQSTESLGGNARKYGIIMRSLLGDHKGVYIDIFYKYNCSDAG